jgi:hypothetical protein
MHEKGGREAAGATTARGAIAQTRPACGIEGVPRTRSTSRATSTTAASLGTTRLRRVQVEEEATLSLSLQMILVE